MNLRPNAILQAKGLTCILGVTKIVDDLDLALYRGQTLGLIGPNGAGKTTVIDLLSGFMSPTEGTIVLDGREVTGLPPYRRARCGLARTFQESPAIPGLSVLEHLELAFDAAGRAHGARTAARPSELAARLGLDVVRGELGTALPSAQRRLLDLARAVATQPRVLLLDEPFSGLDREEVLLVLREIERLKAAGASVLIVEHRLALLNDVADAAVALVQGAPLATGTLSDVLRNHEVQKSFLGTGILAAPKP